MLSTREAAAIKSRIACAIGCRCISNGVVMLKMKIEKWLQLMSEASCLEEEGIPAGVHRTGSHSLLVISAGKVCRSCGRCDLPV